MFSSRKRVFLSVACSSSIPRALSGMARTPLVFRGCSKWLIVSRQITVNDLPVGRSVDETVRLLQAFQFTVRFDSFVRGIALLIQYHRTSMERSAPSVGLKVVRQSRLTPRDLWTILLRRTRTSRCRTVRVARSEHAMTKLGIPSNH